MIEYPFDFPDDEEEEMDRTDDDGNVQSVEEWDRFDPEIFNVLPDVLRCVADYFDTQIEKEGALFSMLILCSGVLPKYTTVYNKRTYEANLFGYLYGSFGAGKGVIPICKGIFKPIHEKRLRQKFAEYANVGDKSKVNKRNPDRVLFLPGNATKSALYQLLEDNDGRGIIVETEADTITTALKAEHGGFSDIFRASFEHEELSQTRKADGLKYIPFPAISILLSSTPQQIKRLLQNVENGLFSRFVFYKIPPSPEFKDVFENEDAMLNEDYYLSDMFDWLMEELRTIEGGATFRFTKNQQTSFLNSFSMLKKCYQKEYDGELDGVVHRYGVIMTRIAMVLTMLRTLDVSNASFEVHKHYICSDEDYNIAHMIVSTLQTNTESVFELLTETDVKNEVSTDRLKEQLKQEEKVLYFHKLKMSHSKIALNVFGKVTAKSKVHRILKKNGY